MTEEDHEDEIDIEESEKEEIQKSQSRFKIRCKRMSVEFIQCTGVCNFKTNQQ